MRCVNERLSQLLPQAMLDCVEGRDLERAEEIRLRMGCPPFLLLDGKEQRVGTSPVSERDIAVVLDKASRSSLHAVLPQLGQGFIQAGFGIRLGVCGTFGESGLCSLRDVSSLALRIPHELRGIGAGAIDKLRDFDCSVLIISPPGGGKTSFLRELIRCASASGQRVCLCDERGEVAAMWQGKSSFDLGEHTDVLSGGEKAKGIMMLLRAMNPRIIALDEISAETDGAALEQAISCGARIFATAHGTGLEGLKRRPHYRKLLDSGLFQKAVVISGESERHYEVVDI